MNHLFPLVKRPDSTGNLKPSGVVFLLVSAFLLGNVLSFPLMANNRPSAAPEHATGQNIINTFPYLETFENEPLCSSSCSTACDLVGGWKNAGQYGLAAAGTTWRVDENDTPSSETGPPVDHTLGTTDGNYLYVESSGCNSVTADLISDQLDFTSLPSPGLEFWYHMYGSTMGTIQVDVSVDGGISFTNLTPAFTDNQNEWQKIQVSFGAYGGQSDVRIRIRAVTGTSFTSDMAIDDLKIFDCSIPLFQLTDIGLLSNNCVLTSAETVTLSLYNNGCSNLPAGTLFNVSYSLNGAPAVVENFSLPAPVLPGDTYVYSFSATVSLTGGGAQNITATADNSVPEQTLQTLTEVLYTGISSFPYSENFESGSGGWNSYAAPGFLFTSWELGTPAKPVINSAHSGTQAWVTNTTQPYTDLENGYVQSPCLDLRNLLDAQISLWIWWNCEFSWDGAVLQSSIDAGASWQNVGVFGDPHNWYTDNTVNGAPGGSQEAWSGRNSTTNGSGGWVEAYHDISHLAGLSPVYLRIAFGTDGSVVDDGFAFDDIHITGTPACADADNDGFTDATCGGTDCNDNDDDIFPGNPEICDGKDNNCSGTTDEGQSLPAGWSSNNVGGASVNGSASVVCGAANTTSFSVSAKDFSTSSADKLHLVARQFCGNGEIIAHVASVSGGGWGGITFRESLAAGSKKVALKMQSNGAIRREVRSTTNGPTSILNYPPSGHSWLRLVRSGSTFTGYTSADGITWTFAFSTTVSMTGCIYAGLFSESINANVTTTAIFDHVTITGGTPPPLAAPATTVVEMAVPNFEVYPNPTTGAVTLNFTKMPEQNFNIQIFNALGERMDIAKANLSNLTEQLDLSHLADGVYLIQVTASGQTPVSKRVVMAKTGALRP